MRTNVVIDDSLMKHAQLITGIKTKKETIDSIIAAYCMSKNIPILTKDKDFSVFAEHFSLNLIKSASA